MTRTQRNPATLFLLAALTVTAACIAILRSRLFVTVPDIAAWGATFDLTITIPLLYWFFVVRGRGVRPITIAPVFVVCMTLAALVIPRGQQFFLRDLHLLSAPLEVVTIVLLVRRMSKLRGRFGDADPLARMTIAAREMFGNNRAAEIVASEVAVLYYAFFTWRRKPDESEGFTFHQRNGWGSILACILVVVTAEAFGMHLLLLRWSPIAAWVWTSFDVYAVLWLFGDYHALRLRRSTISADMLHLRFGLRWSVDVPLANIAAVEAVHGEADWKRKDVLKVAILDEPRWLVRFHEPVVVHGLAGLQKRVTALALLPDQEGALNALPRA
ncbi:MAG TPA: hypothetical protein VFN10_14095 [Thermoanaerobaculia bacterium]|nr:hypothetical protein [Thermoanaerobaculia bacterium]